MDIRGSLRVLTRLACCFSSALKTSDCVLWECQTGVTKSPPTPRSHSPELCLKNGLWTALMRHWIKVTVAPKSNHGSPISKFRYLSPLPSLTASMWSHHLNLKRGVRPSRPVQGSQAVVLSCDRLKVPAKEHRISSTTHVCVVYVACFHWLVVNGIWATGYLVARLLGVRDVVAGLHYLYRGQERQCFHFQQLLVRRFILPKLLVRRFILQNHTKRKTFFKYLS